MLTEQQLRESLSLLPEDHLEDSARQMAKMYGGTGRLLVTADWLLDAIDGNVVKGLRDEIDRLKVELDAMTVSRDDAVEALERLRDAVDDATKTLAKERHWAPRPPVG